MQVPVVGVAYSTRAGLVTDTPGRQPCVFLDRDGVINGFHDPTQVPDKNDRFIHDPDEMDRMLIPGAIDAIARLSRETHARVIIVTNQSCVGRQSLSPEMADAIMQRVAQRVEEKGGHLDAVYFSTNGKDFVPPPGTVNTRKPDPGLLLQAALDFGPQIDLADSYIIGDMTTDIAAGKAADPRLTAVLVETGFAGSDRRADVSPDQVCANISSAVDWIIARERAR